MHLSEVAAAGSVLKNALVFTEFQWVTFHLDV
jgi:hypothetical protein